MLKNGENGKGILSCWYPETLEKRILEISLMSERIAFIEGNGVEAMKQNIHRADTVFFIDPPYTAAGKKAGSRLYTHCELDHGCEMIGLIERQEKYECYKTNLKRINKLPFLWRACGKGQSTCG